MVGARARACCLAATDPDRVRGTGVVEPIAAHDQWAPDYPWGVGRRRSSEELAELEHWGTIEYGRSGPTSSLAERPPCLRRRRSAGVARRVGTPVRPDVAIELDTDLVGDRRPRRAALVQAPTLLIVGEGEPRPREGRVRRGADAARRAQGVLLPGWMADGPGRSNARPAAPGSDRTVRRHGAEARGPGHDPLHGAVHRHRRLHRAAGAPRRPRLEGPGRAAPRSSSERRSATWRASRTTPPATASTPPSTAPPARSTAPRRSATASATSASRSAPGSTRVSAR